MIDLCFQAPSRAAFLADMSAAAPWLIGADGGIAREPGGIAFDDHRGRGIPIVVAPSEMGRDDAGLPVMTRPAVLADGYHANLRLIGKHHAQRAAGIEAAVAAAGGALPNGTRLARPKTPKRVWA
ncbi:MAG: hypothetical protein AB7O45_12410 [Alphaproteobacteria bacterium]